jgi:hypothetical protein
MRVFHEKSLKSMNQNTATGVKVEEEIFVKGLDLLFKQPHAAAKRQTNMNFIAARRQRKLPLLPSEVKARKPAVITATSSEDIDPMSIEIFRLSDAG